MTDGAPSTRRWVRWVIAIVTLGLIGIFARSVEWSRAWSTLSGADPLFVVAAVVANLASVIVKAFRWHLFLTSIGVRSIGLAMRATLGGAALNNVVFANGGDAARVAAVAAHARVSSADVLATLAVDKLCDLAGYAIIFLAVAFALPLPAELDRWRTPLLCALGFLALIGVVAARRARSGADGIDYATGSVASRLRSYVRRLVVTIPVVATRRRLAVALLLAFVAWGAQWATFHFAARAASFPASSATSLLALLTVNASFLIRLTPGNIGVFQFLYALAATSAGLDSSGAVAVSFLISLIQYIPVTSIGLVLASSLARRCEPKPARQATSRTDIVTVRTGGNRERAT